MPLPFRVKLAPVVPYRTLPPNVFVEGPKPPQFDLASDPLLQPDAITFA
jgi:hypothetical protein